ncbi:hypothetical protein HK100_005430 [Physocladia obscura]|uniref:Uncharacterized protein n=1 Tax=Physocladia obscura TaxID=109957 RepID=A0AAD5SRM9_9FUNG|nr:hypothetical protein HK100_005430 [Physocladia obscura]
MNDNRVVGTAFFSDSTCETATGAIFVAANLVPPSATATASPSSFACCATNTCLPRPDLNGAYYSGVGGCAAKDAATAAQNLFQNTPYAVVTTWSVCDAGAAVALSFSGSPGSAEFSPTGSSTVFTGAATITTTTGVTITTTATTTTFTAPSTAFAVFVEIVPLYTCLGRNRLIQLPDLLIVNSTTIPPPFEKKRDNPASYNTTVANMTYVYYAIDESDSSVLISYWLDPYCTTQNRNVIPTKYPNSSTIPCSNSSALPEKKPPTIPPSLYALASSTASAATSDQPAGAIITVRYTSSTCTIPLSLSYRPAAAACIPSAECSYGASTQAYLQTTCIAQQQEAFSLPMLTAFLTAAGLADKFSGLAATTMFAVVVRYLESGCLVMKEVDVTVVGVCLTDDGDGFSNNNASATMIVAVNNTNGGDSVLYRGYYEDSQCGQLIQMEYLGVVGDVCSGGSSLVEVFLVSPDKFLASAAATRGSGSNSGAWKWWALGSVLVAVILSLCGGLCWFWWRKHLQIQQQQPMKSMGKTSFSSLPRNGLNDANGGDRDRGSYIMASFDNTRYSDNGPPRLEQQVRLSEQQGRRSEQMGRRSEQGRRSNQGRKAIASDETRKNAFGLFRLNTTDLPRHLESTELLNKSRQNMRA